jgi:hypothetical protein
MSKLGISFTGGVVRYRVNGQEVDAETYRRVAALMDRNGAAAIEEAAKIADARAALWHESARGWIERDNDLRNIARERAEEAEEIARMIRGLAGCQ